VAKAKKVEERKHRWGGAGYVCVDCGAIKDTSMERKNCPGSGKTGFDVWLYHAGAGWWLDWFEVETKEKAVKRLTSKIGTGNTVAGAILPAGQPLGLFTKQWGEK
jgi:hypothetical protein